MRKCSLFTAIVAGGLSATVIPVEGDDAPRPGSYPAAPQSETVDIYHGTKVVDRYRPLEDPDSPATRAWIDAENRGTSAFLESIPGRAGIKRRLTELSNFEKYAPPDSGGGTIFLHL